MTPLRNYATIAMLFASAVNADEFVDQADANGDGYISLYELRAAYFADIELNRRIEQSFADYDTNGDGLISEAERRAQRDQTAATSAPTVPTAPTAPAASVSNDSPNYATRVDDSGSPSPETATAPRTSSESLPNTGVSLGRTETWIEEIDSDNSGGASYAELIASGDGRQWFTGKSFQSADKNGDGELNPDELEALMQSLARQRR
ncbi:MAG: EF-hand domain-containing protein [Gammaproteobacteria bacterium]|nr:EF-hand domain-containing protein [Gammaproteobacteria bacterium]